MRLVSIHRGSLIVVVLCALAVGATFAASLSPTAQPAAFDGEYVVLSRVFVGTNPSIRMTAWDWELSDRTRTYGADDLHRKLRLPKDTDWQNAAILVNALADQRWELTSHSALSVNDAANINNGNTAGVPQVVVKEQWWFRREKP